MSNSGPSTCPKCRAPISVDAPQGLCPKCVLEGAATTPTTSDHAGHRSPPPPIEEVAARFPQLEILELIGAGGMGAVYKARQPRLDRFVALKILSLDLAANPAFAERFNREARVLARLNHPNIVTVYDFGQEGDYFYLLMEYVDGVNLRQAMNAGGFKPSEALALVPDLCAALQFAHDEGILHRDIKPENILIDARGRVKVADFGIAKLIGSTPDSLSLTESGAVLGTPHYMAPEQLEKAADIDHRADIYSLGVVFYEMLTGELPLGRFAPPSEKAAMDARVDDVVMRTLEKERSRRYQKASEVKTSVEAITHSTAKVSSQPPPIGQAAPSSPSTTTAAATAGWVTLAAVLTGLSLVLALPVLVVAIYFLAHRGLDYIVATLILLGVCLLVAVPGIVGCVFGVRALREIRESDGHKRGLNRALFASLAWPLLLLNVAVTGLASMGAMATQRFGLLWLGAAFLLNITLGELIVLGAWRWARCLKPGVRASGETGTVAVVAGVFLFIITFLVMAPITLIPVRMVHTVNEPVTQTQVSLEPVAWLIGRPALDARLIVPPGHVAVVTLERRGRDATNVVGQMQGFVVASDDRYFKGNVQVGEVRDTNAGGPPHPWTMRFLDDEGSSGSCGGYLSGGWSLTLPGGGREVDLTRSTNDSITIAYHSTGPFKDENLVLVVTGVPREGPLVPEFRRIDHLLRAGSTNWVESIQ